MITDTHGLVPLLSGERTRQAFLFGGFLLTLMNFASPAGGTMMMLFYALYYFSIRFGDLFAG
ncbi:MAG: hypothetical protein ACLPTF_26865 [Steroidobacteraceae bacterium]